MDNVYMQTLEAQSSYIPRLKVGDLIKPDVTGAVILAWPGKQEEGLYAKVRLNETAEPGTFEWQAVTLKPGQSMGKVNRLKGLIVFIDRIPKANECIRITNVSKSGYAIGLMESIETSCHI